MAAGLSRLVASSPLRQHRSSGQASLHRRPFLCTKCGWAHINCIKHIGFRHRVRGLVGASPPRGKPAESRLCVSTMTSTQFAAPRRLNSALAQLPDPLRQVNTSRCLLVPGCPCEREHGQRVAVRPPLRLGDQRLRPPFLAEQPVRLVGEDCLTRVSVIPNEN
jgi:hypothetical protein